jgi:PhoPQ-activated pathogenicity-related protein
MDIQRSSLQRRIFSKVPGPKCFRKVPHSSHTIVNHFVTTSSVEKGKSSGHRKVMENVVENVRDHLVAYPRTY